MLNTINTICLIDDDQTYLFLTKRMITMNKLCQNLLVYENGRVAIDGLRNFIDTQGDLPDMILLDINMPEMDGWGFLEEFISLKPHIEKEIIIYMVSSSIDDQDIQRANKYDEVSDYIVKPISRDALQKLFVVE